MPPLKIRAWLQVPALSIQTGACLLSRFAHEF